MGVVFAARHAGLGREVALKLRLAHGDVRGDQRFLIEAQAAARLRHPAIVAVHEIGRDEVGRAWIAVDLVQGASLDEALRRGPLEVERAARLALGIARALEHAHAHGVLHRDLKPSNDGFSLAGHGAVHVPGRQGVVFLAGAHRDKQVQSNVWRWSDDGLVELQSEAPLPPGRRLFGAAWDPEREAVVIVGAGEAGGDEHWEWSPSAGWRPGPALPMGPRRGPSLLWTHRGLLMLCGGRPGDDAWLRHDGRWTELELSERPPARQWQAAAYDRRRKVVVLFGGQPRDGQWLGDTWELDLGERAGD